MAYRAGAPDEAIIVHAGILAPWRGLVAAGVCALAAGLVWHVAGAMGFALWLPMSALSLFALASTARRARSLSVQVRVRARLVSVRERALGGVGEERELVVGDEDALGVASVRDSSWLGQLPAPALRRSSLVLITPSGEVALTSPLPGAARSRAIAERLRGLLALPSPVRWDDAPTPQGWPNVRTYTAFAVMSTVATIAITTFEAVSLGRTGQIDVVCTEHCFFEGMECLPGGRISGRYEPGERVVRVADPRAPGGLREVRVPVALGHRTAFECRADASTPAPVPER